MKITFQLTQKDLVKFNEYHSAHSPLHIKTLRRQRILVPIIYLVIAAFSAISLNYTFATMFSVLSVLWFLLYPKWIKKRCKKYFTKHVEENFSNVDKEPSSIELQEDGIHSTSHMGHSTFKYSVIEKVVENDGVTYIYIGKGIALVIPHDRVSADDRNSLITEIEQRKK
jgi:hypothetical protein